MCLYIYIYQRAQFENPIDWQGSSRMMVKWPLLVTVLAAVGRSELVVKPNGMFYEVMVSNGTWDFPEDFEAAQDDTESRIVGGDIYQRYRYSFVAGVARASSTTGQWVPFCGGSVISSVLVLTAAHCTDPVKTGTTKLAALLGYYDILKADAMTAVNEVKKIIQHEKYDCRTMANDISILMLSSPVVFSIGIAPIALPTDETDVTGQTVKILGWGAGRYGGPMNNLPKEMDTKVVPTAPCSTAWGGAVPAVKPTQICTLSPNASPCQGDSGGPVVWLDPKTQKYVLVGVVSFGPNCTETKPSVQVKVASYLTWIFSKVTVK